MQHKLYSKLVARLDDGTISVDTVKHPVSFGQVAVLNAMGHIYTVLNGATAADAQAYKNAGDIINACEDKALLRKLTDLTSAISVFLDVTTRYGGDDPDKYRELNRDFAELVLELTTGVKASVASITPSLKALAAANTPRMISSKVSDRVQGADVITKMLTVLAETQLEQAQKAVDKLLALA